MNKRPFPAPAPRADTAGTTPAPLPARRKSMERAPSKKDRGSREHGHGKNAGVLHISQHTAPPRSKAIRHDEDTDKALQPGIKPVLELLQRDPAKVDTVFMLKDRRGKDTQAILDLCRASSVRFNLVDRVFLDRLWPGRHQGVLARLAATGFSDLATVLEQARSAPLPLILALDQVQDPGNAGALARALYAFGGGGLIVPRHNSAYLGAAAAKASAGALERLAVGKVANLGQALDSAKDAGFALYGAASLPKDAAETPDTLRHLFINAFDCKPELPAVLVLGGEEGGLRPGIAKRCAALLYIPLMRDFDSLNVAQAGAVILAGFAARHSGLCL